MSNPDFVKFKNDLMGQYASKYLNVAQSHLNTKPRLSSKDALFANTLYSMANCLDKYDDPIKLDAALGAIDLQAIYSGVEKRETENTNKQLGYDDFVVQELLYYFKNNFFKWVTKPECPICQNTTHVENIGATTFPASRPNLDQISIIEKYKCTSCGSSIEFPRVNNPVSLLSTRSGRCGEWVNCFLLVLNALIGDITRIRYIWNQEDHVWCEYYSINLKRWIHLDPCEAVFDEPMLYCNNWGKQMSWVIGFGHDYIIDLSPKYISKEKQINQLSIVDSKVNIRNTIKLINYKKLLEKYQQITDRSHSSPLLELYDQVILRHSQELLSLNKPAASKSHDLPIGRQTGDAEWTKARGEDGC